MDRRDTLRIVTLAMVPSPWGEAPSPRLIPERLEDRVAMFGYSHEICGENGLGWSERLRSVHQALAKPGGDPAGVSAYLGRKYGYTPEIGECVAGRVVTFMNALAAQLERQRSRGSRFFVGDDLTALDVYWAAFSNAMRPLAPELCPMAPAIREMFTLTEPAIVVAMHLLLFEHRDFIFQNYLELPVDLS
jgi:glutathione S-transferase